MISSLGGIIMTRIHIHIGLAILCIGLLVGCDKTQRVPRFAGIVVVSSDDNHIKAESDLINGGSLVTGIDYQNPKETSWKAELKWEIKKLKKKNDVYLFEWIFIPSDGAQVTNTMEVRYNGAERVFVLQNEQHIISIEPGYIPLSENARPIYK
jgi:hypothetical protein